MDEARRLTGEMEVEEQGLLERRADAADGRVRRAVGTVVLLAAFAVLSVALWRFGAASEPSTERGKT